MQYITTTTTCNAINATVATTAAATDTVHIIDAHNDEQDRNILAGSQFDPARSNVPSSRSQATHAPGSDKLLMRAGVSRTLVV